MEYLQYIKNLQGKWNISSCFKPYYKWNTFNTVAQEVVQGLDRECFKPYYKWNTFNTWCKWKLQKETQRVLNLIINGIPSILCIVTGTKGLSGVVLNLIINGIPSILLSGK